MLSMIVLFLTISHSVGLADFILNEVTHVVYREIMVVNILVVTLNASVNFFVYNRYSKDFNKVFALHIRSKFHFRKESTTQSSDHCTESLSATRVETQATL